ncbi:MAG: hypothetical protein DME26_11555, partial [Verrucomicrobia bacterium]
FLVPFAFGTEEWHRSRGDQRLRAIARLKPGVTVESARAEMRALAARLKPLYPGWKKDWSFILVPMQEQFTGEVKPTLLVILGAVGFVLLIGCVNVANLLLARSATRQKEIAVRAALGADRWRIDRRGSSACARVARGCRAVLKSFLRLQSVPPGFDSKNVLTMYVSLDETRYPSSERRAQFLHQIFEQLEALPGAESACQAITLPMIGWSFGSPVSVEGRANQPEFGYGSSYDFVAGHYFRTLRIPLLKGRDFTQRHNSTNAPRVAIFNEALAKRVFPDEDPVGKRIRFWGELWEVIGVVGSVRHNGLNNGASERVYLPQVFCPWIGSLAVRTTVPPMTLRAPVRQAILSLDPDQPVANIRTLEQMVSDSVAQRRLTLMLLGIFACAALLLAAIGLYGVMAYAVAQRTQEIGLRMALGAQRSDVLKLIVRHGMRLTLFGVAFGLAGSYALTRVIATQLYEVRPTDPTSFASVSVLLALVALVACWLPARRATKVDPMEALRYE